MAIAKMRRKTAIETMRSELERLMAIWPERIDETKRESETAFLSGAEHVLAEAGLSEIPMKACAGATAFAEENESEAFEKKLDVERVMFAGERDGYEYAVDMIRTIDEFTGEYAIGVGLRRQDEDGWESRYAGNGKWSKPILMDYELPVSDAVLKMAEKSPATAAMVDAYCYETGDYPDERETRKMIMRNAHLVRLMDETGYVMTPTNVLGNAKAILASRGEGVSVEQRGANRFGIGVCLSALWPDGSGFDYEFDPKVELSYEETKSFLDEATKSKFVVPFSKKTTFRTNYDAVIENERTVAELTKLAEEETDERTRTAILDLAEKFASRGSFD